VGAARETPRRTPEGPRRRRVLHPYCRSGRSLSAVCATVGAICAIYRPCRPICAIYGPVGSIGVPVGIICVVCGTSEPAFAPHAYFLQFKFEPNHYALVGREQPTAAGLASSITRRRSSPRGAPGRSARADRDDEIEEKMNKVSLITLWVDAERHQILKYTFDDIDMDFLPGRSLARVDDVKATMRMGQPFPDVWLPRDIEMQFRMTMAVGPFDARYRVEYHDYRQADVTYRIR
jgi:hypothetical protein